MQFFLSKVNPFHGTSQIETTSPIHVTRYSWFSGTSHSLNVVRSLSLRRYYGDPPDISEGLPHCNARVEKKPSPKRLGNAMKSSMDFLRTRRATSPCKLHSENEKEYNN